MEKSEARKSERQRKIMVSSWTNLETQSVEQLPEGIDGLVIYEVRPFSQQSTKALKDGRKWKKTCPTNWKGHSRVRFFLL